MIFFKNSRKSREVELTKLSIPFQVAETMGIKIYMFNWPFFLYWKASHLILVVLNLMPDIKNRMFLNQEHMDYKFANIYMHDNMNIEEMWGSGWNLWEKKIKK